MEQNNENKQTAPTENQPTEPEGFYKTSKWVTWTTVITALLIVWTITACEDDENDSGSGNDSRGAACSDEWQVKSTIVRLHEREADSLGIITTSDWDCLGVWRSILEGLDSSERVWSYKLHIAFPLYPLITESKYACSNRANTATAPSVQGCLHLLRR